MRNRMMISVMLLISFSLVGCEDAQDIDICLFKHENQTFFCKNAYKKTKWEFSALDAQSNKLVCSPYQQYIKFKEDYVCKRK